ncbi:MAG: sugar transferase [Planktotalea sp.]|uniref:sugar transferase n=1 Tax=Planktotalea sp. TaxID=2029877 RepID=UPI003C7623EC
MASHDRRLTTYADIIGGLPRATSELQVRSLYGSIIKPTLDVILTLLVAVPAVLIVGLFALIIMKDGHNPFYRQTRLGKNGRAFGMWKLRSMVPNAESVLDDYLAQNPEARREWDLTQKLKSDPRITPIGRLIRKTSIDELPQLLNVFSGDMALVGPRPMMLDQRVMYPGVAYYAMRPGITGFWQTSSRNESSFAERATFDASYFSEMSLATDLRVLLKTVGVVFAGTGY